MAAKTSFSRWYEANRETYNADRRRKYAENSSLREKRAKAQRDYRKDKKAKIERGVVANPKKDAPLRISMAADAIGCSIEFIRKYDYSGHIPKPTVNSSKRFYTPAQVELLKVFFSEVSSVRFSKDESLRNRVLEEQALRLKTNWSVKCL